MSEPQAAAATAKEGYVSGSDMLVYINDKAVGHCTSHSTKFATETKDRNVKPKSTAKLEQAGLFNEKTIVGLSYTISAEGLVFYNEDEFGYKDLVAAWRAAQPVKVKCQERGASVPYLSGMCIIESVDRTDGAREDAKYSLELSNTGAPDVVSVDGLT